MSIPWRNGKEGWGVYKGVGGALLLPHLLAVPVCSVCKGEGGEIEGLVPIMLRTRPVRWLCRTGQPPVTCTIVSRRLRLFGHIARADPSQDHSCALQAAINRLPTDWRRRRGRPRRTWLRTIESDLQPTNLGLNSAWLRAQDCSKWRSVVEMAMLTAGRATWWWWWVQITTRIRKCAVHGQQCKRPAELVNWETSVEQ